jgi:hypothetical protein
MRFYKEGSPTATLLLMSIGYHFHTVPLHRSNLIVPSALAGPFRTRFRWTGKEVTRLLDLREKQAAFPEIAAQLDRHKRNLQRLQSSVI